MAKVKAIIAYKRLNYLSKVTSITVLVILAIDATLTTVADHAEVFRSDQHSLLISKPLHARKLLASTELQKEMHSFNHYSVLAHHNKRSRPEPSPPPAPKKAPTRSPKPKIVPAPPPPK